jgi:hypothetical protein
MDMNSQQLKQRDGTPIDAGPIEAFKAAVTTQAAGRRAMTGYSSTAASDRDEEVGSRQNFTARTSTLVPLRRAAAMSSVAVDCCLTTVGKHITLVSFTSERFTMKAFRLTLALGLLACVAAYAQPAPDWSAYIGTGHAADARESAADSSALPAPAAAAHWSAFIGTGQVSVNSDRPREERRSARGPVPTVVIHRSAKIGTGHVSDMPGPG